MSNTEASNMEASNIEAIDMRDITAYAPVRVFLSGFFRFLLGGVMAIVAYACIFALIKTSAQQPSANDPPKWLIDMVVLLFVLLATLGLSSGVGRMLSAFSRKCFFRAGRDGIAIRLPRQGWFGRFHLAEYRLKWSEVDRLVHFTYKTNGITTATELRIYTREGTMIRVQRMYFSASAMGLQSHLLTIQASASS
jgi:hypothetical protein